MSIFEEIRAEFEISSKVESVARFAFEGIDPLQDSGVEVRSTAAPRQAFGLFGFQALMSVLI